MSPPAPWQRNAAFGIVAATIVLGWVGDAMWASLVDRNPLALILLNAKPRYLVLTVNQLDPWTYYSVGTVRLLGTKPLVWLIGAWYGPRAVHWVQRQSKSAFILLRWIEEQFARFGWFVVAITTNNFVCLLAGSAGFSLLWFMVLAVVGTLVRLWLLAQVGEIFANPVADLIGLVVEHRVAAVLTSVSVVALLLVWQHRRGGSPLDRLARMREAMEETAGDRSLGDPPPDSEAGDRSD